MQRTNTPKLSLLLYVFALTTALVSIASAQTMLINFGTSNIANWNILDTAGEAITAGNMIDSTGATVPDIALSSSGFTYAVNNSGTYDPGDNAPAWLPTVATSQTWGTPTGSILLSGLNDAYTYDINYVAARSTGTPGSDDRSASYTIDGNSADNVDSTDFNALDEGWTSGIVMTWADVSPTDGSITINVAELPLGEGYATAMRITTIVPEPAEYAALAGLGFLAIAFLRRRRHV